MSTTMTYRDFDFAAPVPGKTGPIPFLNLSHQVKYDAGGNRIGTNCQITLEGTLTPLPDQGYVLIDELQDALVEAFSQPGYLVVECEGTPLINVHAKPVSINLPQSNNNWTETSPFSITLEYEIEPITGSIYVSDVSESWSVQVDENNSIYDWTYAGSGDKNSTVLNITHELSAQGVPVYQDDVSTDYSVLVKPAWQQAKDWVVSQLGISASDINSNYVINLNGSKFATLNHARVENRNERQGSYSVTESWVGLDNTVAGIGGSGIEDFTVNVSEGNDRGITSVSIQGSIQGLEVRNMVGATGSYSVTTGKYTNASGFWNNVRPKLYNRARVASGKTNLNISPLEYSVGHSPGKGTISYQYTYDTRPCNLIEGAIFENISITDIYPTDVFASIPVLGRAKGPVLQAIGTITESKKAVNIDVIVEPPTACTFSGFMAANPKAEVEALLCTIQNDLSGEGVSMFLSSNQGTWDPKSGRYTRSVEWTYSACSGDPVSTSFC